MDLVSGQPPDLSPRDREWLTLYFDCNEDLRALAARLAPGTHESGASLFALADWLRTPPIRAALANWDYAQRRARAARDEADRRVALDALRSVCLAWRPSQSSHRLASSADSRPSSSSPAQHASADSPQAAALIELRRAATTMLRTLSGFPSAGRRTGGPVRHAPSRRTAGSPSHPRRISDFSISDPAVAERLLEKERRENDRFERLIERATRVTVSRLESGAPADDTTGSHPIQPLAETPQAPHSPGLPTSDHPAAQRRQPSAKGLSPGPVHVPEPLRGATFNPLGRGRASLLTAAAGLAAANTS